MSFQRDWPTTFCFFAWLARWLCLQPARGGRCTLDILGRGLRWESQRSLVSLVFFLSAGSVCPRFTFHGVAGFDWKVKKSKAPFWYPAGPTSLGLAVLAPHNHLDGCWKHLKPRWTEHYHSRDMPEISCSDIYRWAEMHLLNFLLTLYEMLFQHI